VEELCTLSAGRWGIVVSKVEPGTAEHQQGAEVAVTVYCDDKVFAAYACAEMRCVEGACEEADQPLTEEPDFVGFVLSQQDIQRLEFLLARVHGLVRDLSKSSGESEGMTSESYGMVK
jgi:hypothetical protein